MPIKPPNQKSRVRDRPTYFGHRESNRTKDYRYYNESPQTYKTDREDRIFDTKGFKQKLREAAEGFSKRINPYKKKK